jgi:hypothetical protein
MARKRVPKVPATKAPKKSATTPDRTEDVPVRFMMPAAMYRRMERQAENLGVSRSTYAKMKVIQGVKADEKGGDE